jgi:hypothetical protein
MLNLWPVAVLFFVGPATSGRKLTCESGDFADKASQSLVSVNSTSLLSVSDAAVEASNWSAAVFSDPLELPSALELFGEKLVDWGATLKLSGEEVELRSRSLALTAPSQEYLEC